MFYFKFLRFIFLFTGCVNPKFVFVSFFMDNKKMKLEIIFAKLKALRIC